MKYEGLPSPFCAACRKGDRHTVGTHEGFVARAARTTSRGRPRRRGPRLDRATRAEQDATYLDAGPAAWDDRDSGPDY